MNQTQRKVLIIDDDKISRKMITKMLEGQYECFQAKDGEEGLVEVEKIMPDVILLDVEMPGINGYEVCDKLKHSEKYRDIPVFFLSGHSSLRERMLGYESGAVDYIVKPCEAEELVAKLSVTLQAEAQINTLSTRLTDVSDIASTAIAGSGEYGSIIHFVQNTYSCDDFESLSNLSIQSMTGFNLNCCFYVNFLGKERFISSSGKPVKELEKQLFNMFREKGQRFNDFGCRTLINYPNVSLLVKNMPIEDQERYGRIKDLLPHYIEAFEAKLCGLEDRISIKKQLDSLSNSFDIAQTMFSKVTEELKTHQNDSRVALTEVYEKIEEKIPSMGLEDDQETFILHSLDETILVVDKINSANGAIQEALDSVLTSLNVETTGELTEQKQFLETLHEEISDAGDSVELF